MFFGLTALTYLDHLFFCAWARGMWQLIQAEDIFQGHTSAVPAFTRRLGRPCPVGLVSSMGGSMGDPP